MTSRPSDILGDLRAMSGKIGALPPRPAGIRLAHSIPYGRVFRQWDTKGRLWVWCHRGALLDAVGPRVGKGRYDGPIGTAALCGIPIYVEDTE